MYFKNLMIILLALSLSGCGVNRLINTDYDLSSSNYVVFVLGIDSESEFTFLQNVGSDEEAKPAIYIQWRGKPQNGYIVGGSNTGISTALLEATGTLCGGGKTIAFDAPDSPKVIYLADIKELTLSKVNQTTYQNITHMELENNFEKARSYIDENYPNLKGKLEPWPYKLVPTEACEINIHIPIILF